MRDGKNSTTPKAGKADEPEFGYMGRIFAAHAGGAFKTGVFSVECSHDRWCSLYRGRACSCRPDIVVSRSDGTKFSVEVDGSILEAT